MDCSRWWLKDTEIGLDWRDRDACAGVPDDWDALRGCEGGVFRDGGVAKARRGLEGHAKQGVGEGVNICGCWSEGRGVEAEGKDGVDRVGLR